jgi:hypothetical protein
MAKRDNIIRAAVGLVALLFVAVPFYRLWRGEQAPPVVTPQKQTASNAADAQATPRRPASTTEMLQAAATLEEAVALMNLLPVKFAENSPQLAPEAQPYIEETADAISRLAGGRKVEIVVAAKDAKSAAAKAKALQASLVARGVAPSNLTASGVADPSSASEKVTYRIAVGKAAKSN